MKASLTVPLEEQLNQGASAGEGSVGTQEDVVVVWLLTGWVQKLGHQAVQSSCLESP